MSAPQRSTRPPCADIGYGFTVVMNAETHKFMCDCIVEEGGSYGDLADVVNDAAGTHVVNEEVLEMLVTAVACEHTTDLEMWVLWVLHLYVVLGADIRHLVTPNVLQTLRLYPGAIVRH